MYYVDRGEPAGFEWELSSRFATELGLDLQVEAAQDLPELFAELRRGQAGFAAAGLSITAERQQQFHFTRSYFEVQPQVIYRAGTARPRNVEALTDGRLIVIAGSSHVERLHSLSGSHPALRWEEIPGVQPLDLMEMVSRGSATYAVIDSNTFAAHQRFHPRLRRGFDLGEPEYWAWAFPAGEDHRSLLERADSFLSRAASDGTLNALKRKYFSGELALSPSGVQTFNRRLRERLPRYETLIRDIAEEFQMDWHLLAAMAYQESHWNPLAQSHTGVRGLMMLTGRTATEMDVDDRLDPEQSLRGGVRYLRKLKRRLPTHIREPDRTWFALAAYNIGRGHLEDARVITERQGGDPNLWEDVASRLPLLQQSQYYHDARYGYARGSEPVDYVRNIRHYQKILAWNDLRRIRPPRPVNGDDYVPESLLSSSLAPL
jgi:membrane-bound lytic murein transglycosylase F